ncbi:MAG: serine hydrolase [Armatimonadetes bacterium]|nr:serine hydrolase [Armatimonadota bacterium]
MLAPILTLLLSRGPDFDSAWAYAEKFNSQAVIVMVNHKVVFEKYASGADPEKLLMMASGSKSFCGVVAAAAATDGLLTYDEKAADTFTEWKSDPLKSKITVRNLLSLNCGLQPMGLAQRQAPRDAGEDNLGGTRLGWEDAKKVRAIAEPGTKFAYGPNPFNIFGALIEAKLKNQTWESYLAKRVLDPLGIKVDYRMRCADGKPQLAGGGYIRPRDWATFGEFVRLEGKWKGKQLIDATLMKELYQPTTSNPAYGMSFWLGVDDEMQMMRARGTAVGNGFRMAAGAGKQRLYIIPSENMVVVRMGRGSTGSRGWDDREFLEKLVPGRLGE